MTQATITRIKRNRNIMTEEEAAMEVKQIMDIVDSCSHPLQEVALRAHATVDAYIPRKTEWVLDTATGVEFPAQLSDQEVLSLLAGKPTPIQVKDGVYFYIPPIKPTSGGYQ